MMQGKAIIIPLAALIVGFGGGFVLRPVIAPASQTAAAAEPAIPASAETAPRATQYFAAHLNEARQVMSGCQSGSVRGVECDNAGQAITEAKCGSGSSWATDRAAILAAAALSERRDRPR